MAMEFSIGGFNVKGWMVAVALPVLSTVSGGVSLVMILLTGFMV